MAGLITFESLLALSYYRFMPLPREDHASLWEFGNEDGALSFKSQTASRQYG
jgi:hypothetical protein